MYYAPTNTSPSQFYVPGPTKWFVGFYADGSVSAVAQWYFLGLTQTETRVSFMGAFEDVRADFAGPMLPADVQVMGETAFVSGIFSKYREPVIQRIHEQRGACTSPTTGRSRPGAMGSLMIQEGVNVSLCLVSPYAVGGGTSVHTGMVNGGLPGFYTFPHAFLHDNYDFPLSVKVKAPTVTMRCIADHNICDGTFSLYNNAPPEGVPLLLTQCPQ